MKTIYLYIKESPIGLKYLGKTERNPFKYNGSGLIWKRHLKKYNLTYKDIKTIILLETTDIQEIKNKGNYYSELYDIVNNEEWANLRPENGDGGDTSMCLNYKPFPIKKGNEHWTRNMNEEQRKQLSLRVSGDKNPSKREDVREKIRKKALGRVVSDETKLKQSQNTLGEKNPYYGKKHTENIRLKMKEKGKGRYTVDWFINKYGQNVGLTKRNEFLERSKKAASLGRSIQRKEHTCPNCGLVGRGGNMKRYHFDNCKVNNK